MRIAAAVRELQVEYGEQVDFVLVSPEDTKGRKAEIDEYELGSHGLIAFAADGSVRARLPGHEYGAHEVREATKAALAE